MSSLSGISGAAVKRAGGARFLVNWRARLFMEDKVIHPATISAVFKNGFCIRFFQAVSIGKTMNMEFLVKFRGANHKIRVKATVNYCQLRDNEANIDLLTSQIGREDNHLLNNVLQELSEAKEFNLRQ